MQQVRTVLVELSVIGLLTVAAFALGRFLTPFVVAVVLAVLIDPLVEWCARRGLPRAWSTLLVLGIVAALLLGLTVSGVARLAGEIDNLLESLPEYQAGIDRLTAEGIDRFSELYSRLPGPLVSALESDQRRLYAGLAGFFRGLLRLIQGAPGFLLASFLSVLATYFISRDKRLILRTLNALTPKEWRGKMALLRRDMGAALAGFLRAQVLLVSLTAVLAVLGLMTVGVQYAWILGLLAGFLDLIPMVGPTGVLGPVSLFYVAQGEPVRALAVLVVLGVIIVVRQVVEPKILGVQMGLHPLVTLIAVYLGFRFFGAAGFFIGPLTAIFLKALLGLTIWPRLREE